MEASRFVPNDIAIATLAGVLVVVFAVAQVHGQGVSETSLAEEAQNPVANLISVPFQSNFNFGSGVDDALFYNLNIQPVYPMKLDENWNWINRPILPINYLPSQAPGLEDEFGVGDLMYQGFLSPAKPGAWIWGAGPVLGFPTATNSSLGSEKWSAGPGLVVLQVKDPWVYGVLINNVWSYAGNRGRRRVNQMTLQPFVNYNFPKGWYLTSSPIITANWASVRSNDRWNVPVGGGVGKLLRIAKQPMNVSVQAYYNVAHPTAGSEWQVRFQVQFLFPTK